MPAPGDRPAAHEQFVETGSARLYVRDVGHGLPIIVVHGGPDFDHEYLLPEMDQLARSFRLVYYDQRGRGRSFSGDAPEDISVTSEIDDLDRVRAHFGFEAVAVLGHSWGGLLAVEFALRHPRRVSHLILMNTAPVSHGGALAFRRALEQTLSPAQWERRSELLSDPQYLAGNIDADLEYYRIHFASTLRAGEQLERVVSRLRSQFTSAGIVAARAIEDRLYALTWDAADYDLIPQLDRLDMPTLVLHGDNDLVPADVAREIADAIPESRFVFLADCGHFSYLEQTDRVHANITDLLAPA